ncbi:effector-binding domain-containing protein [Maribacter caenipelagi]|uniref:Effector-binding domain-containing protein n=1 Tax=Maribacter caenipelagi TaxID=1447781 RepID=A0A4R7CWE5_9FLAO|nr:AraC family transcriptional regulator [Maribacter caenipelagi]TDS12560.1 effector-binding domain-containing protein [Maribacter caenipelagi]
MKKALSIIIAIICIGLLWYFFIKPQDYQIRVVAKSNTGTVNQALKSWSKTLQEASIRQTKDLGHLEQMIASGDSTHIYNWNITPINDSTSQLVIDVKDLDHSFANKLSIPFTDTNFEKQARKTVTDFIESLNIHKKEFKVTFMGEDHLPSTYCACVEHKTIQSKKAFGMMESYPFINSVIASNGIQVNGVPFIETTDWNMQNDSISFNFCYPIIKTDSLPTIKDLIYKEFIGMKSLKAIYNGNYMTSDRAWYTLLDYAKEKNIKVDPKPIEFFFNNPNMGGDALRWKAEVFLPIKE